ncbi:MAG: transcription-repair coupling factor [Bacteriovoracaceae bacterium]|nr:transcription-repair coupling factor [Bacteriovoracaceae bacterium]
MKLKLAAKIHSLQQQDSNTTFKLNGINEEQWYLLHEKFIREELKTNKKHQVYVFDNEDQAEKFYGAVKPYHQTLFYPDLGQNIYSGAFSSERNLNDRLLCLNKIHNSESPYLIVTTYNALMLKVPGADFFQKGSLSLQVSDIISPEDLARELTNRGYESMPSTEEPGTFNKKGEIFDIYPLSGSPIRIHYFDDMIEEMFQVDSETLRTKRDCPLESVEIFPMAGSALSSDNVTNFRTKLPRPPLNHRSKRQVRDEILEKLDSGSFFPNYPLYFSLFFNEHSSLLDTQRENSTFHFFNLEESQKTFSLTIEEFNSLYKLAGEQEESEDLLPDPNDLYIEPNLDNLENYQIDNILFESNLDSEYQGQVSLGVEKLQTYISRKSLVSPKQSKNDFIKALFKTVIEESRAKEIWIVYKNEATLKQIQHILETFDQNQLQNIKYLNFDLAEGFVYTNENLFFLSESDFFIHKVAKTKRKKKQTQDVFADQLASLNIDDFVIHKDHGIGQYKGMETIELGNQKGDFIVLEYHDSDKVYVPVYKLDLIQKHSSSTASVRVASLKSKKFEQEKARASKSVKKLAFDLLEVQAKRELRKGFKFSEPDEIYHEFEQKFPFEETEDQLKAINDVLDDMTSQRPMDRLICGDVGFGKTEIAMRAAFKAVLDHKQTAILVPTTVLAFQHYNSMIERFKDFPVNIAYVSRFKSAKETSEILQKLSEGKIDIIIGTHKLLSEKVKFNDLGLLIIDEEQRFGVGHKEKLKALKEDIDCLTMTATPIPRTLQMSFLGIKDFSLIQTPPPKRQSIKTYLIKEDPITLQRAISKELGRGGQVFVVHNKVSDMEDYTAKIKKLSPTAKVLFAHGQMPEKELEKRITQFYERKYDVLVSTTIIESGIDIPTANTMIVDRADTYGLSQLHQLRGRIGRSDKKAYAYFMVPHDRILSTIATKRLKALQTYAEMGAGFSLATSDLEIRGSGDILGGEQSGHIGNIGLELYMELLQEAIAELKQETVSHKKSVEVQTPFHSVIPNNYIEDAGSRLKFYKRLSNASSLEALQSVSEELQDIYGLLPESLNNLLIILESRIHFSNLSCKSVKVGSKQITIAFDREELEQNAQLRDSIISFFMQRPKVYKMNPEFSVQCKFNEKVDPSTLLEFSKHIAQQIDPC